MKTGFLDNPEWAANAADKGPRFIEENFGLERMISETLALYGFDGSE